MEEVHGWSKAYAKTTLIRYGMRKKYAFSRPENAPRKKKEKTEDKKSKSRVSKDCHYYRYCPLQGCTALVKRLPPHLRKVHKLGPKELKNTLPMARTRVRDCHRVSFDERRLKSQHASFQDQSAGQSVVSELFSDVVPAVVDSDSLREGKGTPVTDSNVNNILMKFKGWLQSPDGGQLDLKTSEQHHKQVKKLLSIIDEKNELTALYNDDAINEKFLEGFAKIKYHPKTIQSYLMSLRHFYGFSLTVVSDDGPSKERVIALKEKVMRWSSSFRRSSAKRHWEKMEEDFHALISPEQINEFERSKAARDAVCLLGQLSGEHFIEITQAQYTLLRDFLIVEISIDNANRSGALANMKMGEFKRMKSEGEDSVILVKQHKTLATHGPVRIVLSPKLRRWIQIFIKDVRSCVYGAENHNDCHVFLSWNGEPLASSQISKAMKSIWKKAEIDGTPSSTILRKSAVSGVHSASNRCESHSDLADLMAHNVGTAMHYYKLNEKSKSSVKASRKLRTVMRGEQQQKESNDTEDHSAVSSTLDDCSKNSKLLWPAAKELLVQTIFQDEIMEKSITLEIVRSKVLNHPDLKNEDPKRVLDKVRSLWRYEKQSPEVTEPLSLPSETLSEKVQRTMQDEESASEIIPPTITSSTKNIFSSTELEKLRTTFKEMIVTSVPITKTSVNASLQKESWGRDVLKKNNLDSVINRIKYERRVYRGKKK